MSSAETLGLEGDGRISNPRPSYISIVVPIHDSPLLFLLEEA
jgi:hypothetical protein